MENTIQKHSRIDIRDVDPCRYTETLLAAARACGVYDDEDVMTVQGGLFDLLSERLMHMTNGESCSVPAETAQAVLSAMLYTLDQQLLTAPTPDDAAKRLILDPAASLYEAGLQRIRRRLQASELQYRRYLPLFRALPDSAMKATATDGITGFFRAYRPDGFADAVPITADYPLYLDGNAIGGMCGVSFLGRYLDGLITEARFLSKFRADTLMAVLSASDPLYRETPTNLYAPMLATVIGMVLLHRPFSAWKYGLQGEDITDLQRLYDNGTFTETRMAEAAEIVIDDLMLDGSDAVYLRRAAEKLYDSAVGCLSRHLPMLVFPCTDAAYRADQRGEDSAYSGALSYHGGRMTADTFRCLDYDLRTCTSAAEKTNLILSRVQGLEDICDLLIADTGALDADEKAYLTASLPTAARQYLVMMMGNDLP